MTSPQPAPQDQQSQDALASRLLTANQVTGGNRPQLATILAQSGISNSDMATIGGFAQATNLAVANRLTQDAGAQHNFTPAEQAAMSAINEPVAPSKPPPDSRNWIEKAVDAVGNAVSSTGSFLFNNPIAHGIGAAMNWLGDAAHMPFRMLSAAVGGEDTQARDAQMRALGYDPASEVSRLAFMFNHGQGEYHSLDGVRQSDPNGSQMVDLAVRMQTDPDGYANYKKSLAADPNNQDNLAKLQQLQQLENSPAFAKINAAVDAQHISPGRDLAGLIFAPFGGKTESNWGFRLMSGALDAAYTWFADPTLVGGKLLAGIRAADVLGRDAGIISTIAGSNPVFRAMRAGLQSTTDQPGIYAALGLAQDGTKLADTQAGKFWQGAIDTVHDWVAAHKDALDQSLPETIRAQAASREGQLFNTLNQQYKAALPLVPELAGTRVIVPDAVAKWNETGGLNLAGTIDAAKARVEAGSVTDEDLVQALHTGRTETQLNPRAGKPELTIVNDVTTAKPIEDLAAFADHMASTNGLLRLNGSMAAQQRLLMPGKLSYTAMAKGLVASSASKAAAKVFDYTNPVKLLADPSESAGTDGLMQGYAALVSGDKDAAAQAGRDAYATMKRGTPDANPLQGGSVPTNSADARIGLSGFDLAKRARARWEQTTRRLTSMQPGTTLVDLTDPNSIQQVRNFGRLYMTKYDADRLASSYAMGNLAQRRQILNGIIMQNLHASGVMQSEGGQAFADRFFADQASQADRKYGYGASSQIQSEAGTRDVAIVPSQLSDHVLIPSFRELHYAAGKFAVGGFASKVGLASFRNISESHFMDNLMQAVKMGWITTAAGGLRNALEESVTAIAKGLGPTMLRGRAAFTLADQKWRQDLVDTSKKFQGWVSTYGRDEAERMRAEEIGRIYADGSPDPDMVRQAQLLERAIAHRIPLAFRQVSNSINNVAMGSWLGKLLSYDKNFDIDKAVKYAREMQQPELQAIVREGVYQNNVPAGDPIGDAEAMGHTRAGLMTRKYGFVGSRPDGWGEVEYDGGAGTDAWAKYLGQMYNDPISPAHVWTQALKQTGDLGAATRAVREYMDDPVMQHFVDNAEVLNTVGYNGSGWASVHSSDPAVRAQLQAQAKDEYANRLTDNLLGALSRKDGTTGPGKALAVTTDDGTEHGIAPKLLDRLAKAQDWGGPDRQWLSSELAAGDMPSHVIAQRWAPYNPLHAPGQFPQGYTQMLSVAYQKVAVDQINALTRNPLMAGLYARARDNLAPYEQHLLDSGWDPEVASKTVQKMAVSQAQEEVFRHIDNPYVGTQFSTIARNFWAFERFQEDYLRRWGRTLRDNPEIIRKFQLAIHGGQSSGLVEKDSQGNLTFVYPGSALAMNVFNKAFRFMGLGDQVQIPVHGDLSTQLQFVNASLENPFGFSGTPLLNIPFHVISSTLGVDHPILMASLDKAINGQIGQGKSWWEQMLPSWANRIYSGVIATDPASKFGSAYANALHNAEAAGQLEGVDTLEQIDPATGKKMKIEGGNAAGIANLQHTLQTQVRNNLALEALFGFFLPAAPTLNENVDPAKGYQGNAADLSAHMQGLQSLKDEAQQLLKTMPYDQFKAYWQATHPHELIYNQSGAGARTVVGSPSAYVPADLTAARWMQENHQFTKQYGGPDGVSNYLVPQGLPGTPGGTFSDIAYRAELENGMRQYKSLDQVWKDIVVQRGEDIYYRAKDAFDQSIGTLDQTGAFDLSRSQQQAWDQVQQSIFAGNPLLAEKFGSAGAAQRRTNQVIQLQNMLQDTSPTTRQAIADVRPGLEALLQAWGGYQQQYAKLQGTRMFVSAHQVRALGSEYTAEMKQIQAAYPSLTGLINGVFRTPGMTSLQPTPALA